MTSRRGEEGGETGVITRQRGENKRGERKAKERGVRMVRRG